MSGADVRGADMRGAGRLLRFMLRRERVGLPVWMLAVGAFVALQSVQSQDFYSDPEQLDSLRRTAEGNAALVALAGPPELITSVGGEAVFEVFSFASVLVALMTMVVVTRHSRADEEAGRVELVRSTVVGRRAPLAAALGVAVVANAGVALAVSAAAVATGLPVAGSVLVGAALGSVGVAFAGLTALAAQLFTSARGIYATVVAALGAAMGLRAAGDIGDDRLSWLSPIGWGQRSYPYSDDRWWPLLLPLALGTVATALAVTVLDRRDLGSGVVANRPGRERGSWALRSPLGLAWRLQRGPLLGWLLAAGLLGLTYGSFGDGIEQFVADNPDIADFLPGGAQGVLDSYFSITLTVGAILAAAYAVSAVLRAGGEEASGRLEAVLATPTSRPGWLGSHLVVALGGSLVMLAVSGMGIALGFALTADQSADAGRLVAFSLTYVPAVWVIAAVAALVVGLLPRAARAVSWALVGLVAVVAFFSESFGLPSWVQALSPLHHVPLVPFEDPAALPLLALGGAAAVTLGAGLVTLRRRDIETD